MRGHFINDQTQIWNRNISDAHVLKSWRGHFYKWPFLTMDYNSGYLSSGLSGHSTTSLSPTSMASPLGFGPFGSSSLPGDNGFGQATGHGYFGGSSVSSSAFHHQQSTAGYFNPYLQLHSLGIFSFCKELMYVTFICNYDILPRPRLFTYYDMR